MEEMFITPIRPIKLFDEEKRTQTAGQAGISAFQSIFKDAAQNVRETEGELANQEYLLSTGQLEDPHSVTIAMSEAQLAVDMMVSLRNKALDAYNELTRISL